MEFVDVKEKIYDLLNKLNVELDKIKVGKLIKYLLEIVVQFYIDFVMIYLFYDGNGCMIRIFMNILFISFGYLLIIIKEQYKMVYY